MGYLNINASVLVFDRLADNIYDVAIQYIVAAVGKGLTLLFFRYKQEEETIWYRTILYA
jgi:hypothetical protein